MDLRGDLMNKQIEVIKERSRRGIRITLFIQVILAIAYILMLGLIIGKNLSKGAFLPKIVVSLHLFGFYIFDFLNRGLLELFAFIAFSTLLFVLIFLLLEEVKKTFRTMDSFYSPFTEESLLNIKRVGIYLSIITLLVNGLFQFLIVLFITKMINLIFEYGYQLQVESDETL